MVSAGTSTFRDRTSEFRSLSDTLKKFGRVSAANPDRSDQQNDPSTSSKLPVNPSSYRSEFNKKASRIGLGIHETSKKISRLANLAKKSSIFDDPLKEIQELTTLIKNDITALNVAVSDLQTLQNMEIADDDYSEDRVVHSTAVCDDLKNKLMGATKKFQEVLTARTQNIKAHENRRQIFSTSIARENPFHQPPKSVMEPPPWSSPSKPFVNHQPSDSSVTGVQVGNQLRSMPSHENPRTHTSETPTRNSTPTPLSPMCTEAIEAIVALRVATASAQRWIDSNEGTSKGPNNSHGNNKKKLESKRKSNSRQTPRKKQKTVVVHGVTTTIVPAPQKQYAGILPKCNKCKYHHNGACRVMFRHRCKRKGRTARSCGWRMRNPSLSRPGNECGKTRHFRRDCPKTETPRENNQGIVFAIEAREAVQDPTVVTGSGSKV